MEENLNNTNTVNIEHKEEQLKKEENKKDTLTNNEKEEMTGTDDKETKIAKKKKTKENKLLKELDEIKSKYEELEKNYAELNDKYLRIAAEFDNYKKRTLNEKSDLLKYGSERVLLKLLEIIDDIERAIDAVKKSDNIEGIKEGLELINIKFKEFLKQQGVSEICEKNVDFNIDIHEAISKLPVSDETMKNKVVDVVQKGYKLYDKVIRYAKVVVGE
ncbi:MAG: nucleotide exchange factor GrpE [Bacteroidales bacterium]|nr:nucleotide exchange factor GrpE [Bacteroidales bacterium]